MTVQEVNLAVVQLHFIESERVSGRVWFTKTGYGHDYEILERSGSDRPFRLTKWVGSPVTFNSDETTFEEAKAKAQSDFDRHILKAIMPRNPIQKGRTVP